VPPNVEDRYPGRRVELWREKRETRRQAEEESIEEATESEKMLQEAILGGESRKPGLSTSDRRNRKRLVLG